MAGLDTAEQAQPQKEKGMNKEQLLERIGLGESDADFSDHQAGYMMTAYISHLVLKGEVSADVGVATALEVAAMIGPGAATGLFDYIKEKHASISLMQKLVKEQQNVSSH